MNEVMITWNTFSNQWSYSSLLLICQQSVYNLSIIFVSWCKIFLMFLFLSFKEHLKMWATVSSTELGKIVHAFMSLCLDNYALFTSLHNSSLSCLQLIKNAPTVFLICSSKQTHIIYSLHWLPVHFIICF